MTPSPKDALADTLTGSEMVPTRRHGPIMLIVIVSVVLLAGAGTGAWFFMPPHWLARAKAAPAPPPELVKAVVPLGAVVVNLAGGTKQYLRVAVELGVTGDRTSKDAKTVEEKKPQLVDLVISVLATKTADALMADEGRIALKDELVKRIQEELELKKVARVYFTEFVIQ